MVTTRTKNVSRDISHETVTFFVAENLGRLPRTAVCGAKEESSGSCCSDLRINMWKEMRIGDKVYRHKHTSSGRVHKIQLTDLVSLWFEDIDEQHLLLRCKEMNRLVEANDEVFLSHIVSLLENEDSNVSRDFDDTNNKNILILQNILDGLKFRMKFILEKASDEKFSKEVTQPLLTIMSEFERQQRMLMDLVRRKDVEITEYKLEGAQITRKAVETEPFDESQFVERCNAEVSTCKSRVHASPYSALTPTVLRLWRSIEEAPLVVIPKANIPEEVASKISRNTFVKLKAPSSKKPKKMYEDDEDYQD